MNEPKTKRIDSFKKWIKKKHLHISKKNGSPNQVALGLAIGIFVAFTPLVGVQTLLLLFLFLPFPRANKIAAFLSNWVMNYFTMIPIYILDYWLGSFIFCPPNSINYQELIKTIEDITISEFLNLGKTIYVTMLIGGTISGFTFAILTYFASLKILEKKLAKV